MSLESFKEFVRGKPNLINYVNKNEMTWQKFYEMYELYGSSSDIWNNYLDNSNKTSSFKDILNMFKNINTEELQQGIGSLQKGIGYIQDLIKDKDVGSSVSLREEYKPRPIYKKFDD